LQFRAEAFNAANHAILGDPDTNFGTAQFGQITSTRLDNREIQVRFATGFLGELSNSACAGFISEEWRIVDGRRRFWLPAGAGCNAHLLRHIFVCNW